MTAPGKPTHAVFIRARAAVVDLPGVESAAVMPEGDGHAERLSVVLPRGYDRVPPRVLRTLAEHDLGIADVTPQAEYLVAVGF